MDTFLRLMHSNLAVNSPTIDKVNTQESLLVALPSRMPISKTSRVRISDPRAVCSGRIEDAR